MCSVGDDVYDNEAEKVMPKETLNNVSDVCNKCKTENPCVVLRSKDAYCKDCFLVGTVHKFKASLGKSRLIHANDYVLVWHKIGHPSTAMLHFLRTGLDLAAPKKLRFHPSILYVDDQYHLNLEERKDLLDRVKREVESFGFQLISISFAAYITNPNKLADLISGDALTISDDDKAKIDSFMNKQMSKTNGNYLKTLLRRQLLIDVAKHCNCKFVFTPDISVDVASDLLSNISLGRGSCISIDVGFCDDRDKDVNILRPLRSFDMKELAYYNNLNNLEPLSIKQSKVDPYCSVQELMKKFVTNLQVNYPATVTTILKTGDKLGLANNGTRVCDLCKGPMPRIDDQLTSQTSIQFSHLVSNELLDYSISGQDRFQNISDKFDQNTYINKLYCFSCSKISDHMNKP